MTRSIPVTIVRKDGSPHSLTWQDGQSLMEVIRDNNLPISAECGGSCACATCHVHLDEVAFAAAPDPDTYELEMLEDEPTYVPGRSRLSCQLQFSPDLAGLRAELAAPDDSL